MVTQNLGRYQVSTLDSAPSRTPHSTTITHVQLANPVLDWAY
jgi:hypothetical protein